EGSVSGTQATIPVTMYVSEATAEAGYRWGIEYSVFPSFTKDGHRSTGEWTQEAHSPMDGQTFDTRPDQLIPGKTYYYRAVIYDMSGNAIAGEPVANAHSFQAATDTVPTALTLNTSATVQPHESAVFTFDPGASGNAGSGMYAVVSTGMGNINISREDGEQFSGDWNHDDSADYQFKVPFTAGDGKVYIHANNYIEETGAATLMVMDAQDMLDKLTLGTATSVHQNTVVSFTADKAGYYRVRTVDPSKDFLHIYNSESGEWDWRGSTTGPIEMEAGETRYFIAWYDEDSEGAISLIAEQIAFNPNPATAEELYADLEIANADVGNFNSDFAYTVTLIGDAPLTGNVEIPRTMQLHVAAALTVGSGASLTNHGDLYVDQGGTLTLSSGASFAQSGYDDWSAAFVLNVGSFTNNGGDISGIASDTAVVVIACDEYADINAGMAAAGGISSELIILDVAPQSQTELDYLLGVSRTFGMVELFLSDASFSAPDVVPGNVTFVLSPGGTLTVPDNIGTNLLGSIVLDGGALVNNGTVHVNGGRIQWNSESDFRNNGILNVFPPDSSYVGIARWNPINTATITNNGTVRIFCEGLDESRIIISGGTVHRNTESTATFTLPADVTTIGEEAFAGIDAEAVFIHSGVTSIGKRAFADCPNLQSVNIQDGNRTTDISPDFLEGCRGDLVIVVDPESTAGGNRETYLSYLNGSTGASPLR
ncbi:MAG: leucine-rich repeat protein, partial [Oscillospiraceae bacterium]|nr:leucine-rich repeat protein [Oscillospiraceae bacterium]